LPASISLTPGSLYVVALPIGNAGDLSDNARHVLSLVDIIAAEDTRVFKDFAQEHSIPFKKLVSHHDHNEKDSAQGLLQYLQKGQSIAVVSDAGTPNISDPGFFLVKMCFENNIPVKGLPGPSAVTLALSVCPIGGMTHFFGAFPPASSNDRKKYFKDKSRAADRIVFFESPHRILEHLEDAQEVFKGKVFILREATKKYEELLYLEIPEMIKHFKNSAKGEFVVIYAGQASENLSLDDLKKEIQNLISDNIKPTDILKKLQDLTELTRREVYDLITRLKHSKDKNDD
jgi:16S rRNA (cytidine1402-2'-O)-methyltransferase